MCVGGKKRFPVGETPLFSPWDLGESRSKDLLAQTFLYIIFFSVSMGNGEMMILEREEGGGLWELFHVSKVSRVFL